MAPSTLLAGTFGGLGATTSLISSLAQYQQGQYASEVAGRQAQAMEVQSRQVQQEAGAQVAAEDWKSSHMLSRMAASSAASGVTSEGSPSAVFGASAEEAQINDMYTRYAANVKSSSLIYQADITRAMGAREAAAATTGAVTGGLTGAISSGIQAYGIRQRISPFGYMSAY